MFVSPFLEFEKLMAEALSATSTPYAAYLGARGGDVIFLLT